MGVGGHSMQLRTGHASFRNALSQKAFVLEGVHGGTARVSHQT